MITTTYITVPINSYILVLLNDLTFAEIKESIESVLEP